MKTFTALACVFLAAVALCGCTQNTGNVDTQASTTTTYPTVEETFECRTIPYEKIRMGCDIGYSMAEPDEGYCSLMTEEDVKDGCIMGAAMAVGNQSRCDSIAGLQNRDGCYAMVAINQGDESLCQNIQGNSTKRECLEQTGN